MFFCRVSKAEVFQSCYRALSESKVKNSQDVGIVPATLVERNSRIVPATTSVEPIAGMAVKALALPLPLVVVMQATAATEETEMVSELRCFYNRQCMAP